MIQKHFVLLKFSILKKLLAAIGNATANGIEEDVDLVFDRRVIRYRWHLLTLTKFKTATYTTTSCSCNFKFLFSVFCFVCF